MIPRMLLLTNRGGLETCCLETCGLVDKSIGVFEGRAAVTLQC